MSDEMKDLEEELATLTEVVIDLVHVAAAIGYDKQAALSKLPGKPAEPEEKMVRINGHVVRKPMEEEPEEGDVYWSPDFDLPSTVWKGTWSDSDVDKCRFKIGTHEKEEHAVAYWAAVLDFKAEEV